ncbi:MAG: outer membrane lipoprotein-sorting protein [Proteobacteria bacterium]|nr:outer membrane lipoprotein-sorting protein [Pseudomonadota bacterium]
MNWVRITCVAIFIMTCGVVSQAGTKDVTAIEIMEKMEKLYDMKQDLTAKMKYTVKRVDEGVKVIESIFYRRDKGDQFLSVNISPESDRGNGYLRVESNTWMYRRNTRTFQIVKRDESVSGTDVKTGDLEKKKFTELYEPVVDEQGREALYEETLGKAKIPVYRFKVVAKVKDVTYPKHEYWVRRDNYLLLKQKNYALSGTLMRSKYFPKYTRIDGRYLYVRLIIVDEFEKGNKTMLQMSGISLKPIPDHVFTKAYLENLSK